ncbi:MAG: aminotransferase class V-fold PLP-dependent enzyme, partial [bacterium]
FIDVHIFKPADLNNHFNVVSASFSGYSPDDIGRILNERYNIAVRTGLHCAPEIHRFLGTLPDGLVRFSIGYFNTSDDISKLKLALQEFII